MIKRTVEREASSAKPHRLRQAITRRNRSWVPFVFVAVCVAGMAGAGIAYTQRVRIKEFATQVTAPRLPPEEVYPAADPEIVPGAPHAEPVVQPTSTVPVVPTPPEAPEPTRDIVAEKLLAVPFTIQAPTGTWDFVHNETCEEASILMVVDYYRGKKGRIPPEDAERRMQQLIGFQKELFGFFEDTNASQTKRLIEWTYPKLKVDVVPLEGAEQIKRLVAEGTPVIIPADGKALPNPNFRNGGPRFHMLVVRGYTGDKFITNDPGTRLGENFLYTYDGLLNAVHDWNGGDVPNGERVVLVVRPR